MPTSTDSDLLPEAPFLAAVDLGSNSFHMKIVRVVGDELEVIDRIREMVRLASGLDKNVNLTEFKLKVSKDGGDVDAITAATITSRAYCDATQRAYDELKKQGGN